jgi:hypothetical protein
MPKDRTHAATIDQNVIKTGLGISIVLSFCPPKKHNAAQAEHIRLAALV